MFCTNPRKPTAFHNVLADVVETGGGSRQLLKILNQLGCVSSPDTHDRFVSMHANDNRERNVWTVLSPTAFTVASVTFFKAMLQYTVVISISAATMELQCSWCNLQFPIHCCTHKYLKHQTAPIIQLKF